MPNANQQARSTAAPAKAVSWVCDPSGFRVDPAERELFDRQLRSFVPPDSFDVHAHLYDLSHFGPAIDASPATAVGYDVYHRAQASWMGDAAPAGGLFFPFPVASLDVPAANRFLLEQIAERPGSRGLMLITPGDDPDRVEAEVRRGGWAGFKVYWVYARGADPFFSPTEGFVPQCAWEIADRHGLVIMLHLVLRRALADETNGRYVREHCLRYPGARLVLAHAARGFCAAHTVEGVDALRGLDNVYFDTSAVCEPQAMEAILRRFGPARLMYGSDFPVSEAHGRPVSLGDGFFWLYENNADFAGWRLGRPVRAGIESLLALRQACRTCRLTDADVERIFRGNARRLLGLDRPADGSIGATAYRQARQVIPGGTQLLSKRPELYAPDQWPAYFREARGCQVIDLDGRTFLDFTTNGIGSCLLGYADPDVTAAVVRRVELGSMCTLNDPAELELAQLLLDLHPWAQRVRYARTGGEAMAVAVRIARAATGRDTVAFCGYHGWSDWYLAANLAGDRALDGHLLPGLSPAGVPRGLGGTSVPFAYNQLDQLTGIFERHRSGGGIAAVVLEPTRNQHPAPGFLEGARELCDRHGARLVFDEITAGFRFTAGGAHLRYGVRPDVAVFAKALGNGHPIAAIIGTAQTMEAAQESFISSTYWTEGVGPAAAIATLRRMRGADVPAHIDAIGRRWRAGCEELARRHGLPLRLSGHPCLTYAAFDHPEGAALMTLLTVRMLSRGILAGSSFYPTLAHEPRHVDAYLEAAEPVFAELAQALRSGDIRERIGGPVKDGGFRRLA